MPRQGGQRKQRGHMLELPKYASVLQRHMSEHAARSQPGASM